LPRIILKNFGEIEVIYKKLGEQSKIAKVLTDLDTKIELNNKINAELEAMAKLIYDYWFVQFDFPDENGKPYKSSGGKMVYNEALKREVPDGWEVQELKEIAKCIMGQSPKGESYNKEQIGTPLLNGPADYENGALKGRTYTTSPKRLCKKDDMVLCIRATIGKLVYSEQEFCLGRGVAAVRPNEKRLSELVYNLLQHEILRFKIQATGSIIKGITKDDLIESKCLIPNDNLIDSFHKLIRPKFDKIRINKKENQKLSELRDWLLPMLMNGQVKVK
ncbi:MAG: restriction endonuclease subunit S, partial [Flavobacteriales bacterium]|nr:restriction endonuclease subunit S [Flavobacteriales bacterium]